MAGGVAEFVLTRSVRDSAAMLDATAGEADGDPYAAPARARPYVDEIAAEPKRLRIAVADGADNGAAVAPECRRALLDAAKLCERLGHAVEEASPECDGPAAWRTFQTLMTANILVNLRNHPTAGRLPGEDEVERVTFDAMERGAKVSAADYVAATQAAHRLGRQFGAFHRRFDVLLTPALGALPPKTGWLSMMQDPAEYWRRIEAFTPFSVWFNLTGQPAMVLPMGATAYGFPLAVQAVARFGDEATLFRLAAQIEREAPWADRRPPLAKS
jgi:Asp-tRNA(Asn)/Glu-tRNA(Gln) amidotransferase A subunit family amidase